MTGYEVLTFLYLSAQEECSKSSQEPLQVAWTRSWTETLQQLNGSYAAGRGVQAAAGPWVCENWGLKELSLVERKTLFLPQLLTPLNLNASSS